ncbi:MAG: glycosyltransferase family 4 protein [Pseudomonadota bacterium]
MQQRAETSDAEPAGRSELPVGQNGAQGRKTVLLLAQLPPPIHGVSTVTARVKETLERDGDFVVRHRWLGGAVKLTDVGKRSLKKYVGFAKLLALLAVARARGRKAAIAYLTLAPHGDAALRDVLLVQFAKRAAHRCLVHVHTRGLEEILDGSTRKRRAFRSCLKGTELIALSRAGAASARASGIFVETHYLPNTTTIVTDKRAGSGDQEPAERTLRCGFFGSMDARKGVLRFVDAIEHLRNAGLDVSGVIAGGDTKYLTADAVRGVIADRGLGDHIDVRGFVPDDEKEALLGALDILIYPSEHDLAPLVILEVMARGVIPIAFDTGAIAELMGDDFADHVVRDTSPGVFAAQVEQLVRRYSDGTARTEAAERARRHIEEHHAPEAFEAQLLRIFTGADRASAIDRSDMRKADHNA